MELAPRPEYGLVPPAVPAARGRRRATLRRPAPVAVCAGRAGRARRRRRCCARASRVREGERVGFALRWACRSRRSAPPEPTAPADVADADRRHRRGLALLGGRARHLRGPAPRPRAPSARACSRASPTGRRARSSPRPRPRCPETVGGERNWDYRFSWIRDSEPHARGALHRRLLRRGRGVRLVHDELRPAAAPARARCRSCTGSAASTTSPSASSPHLRGWRDSAPGARRQRRLGPDPARRLRRAAQRAVPLPRAARRAAPRDPGASSPTSPTPPRGAGARRTQGMWEMRGEPRHHLSSKVLCWTALDRAVRARAAARRARQGRGVGAPSATRSAPAILERGWSEARQAYAQSFDSDELDAAAAADADPRLPAGRRRAHALDDRGDRRAT